MPRKNHNVFYIFLLVVQSLIFGFAFIAVKKLLDAGCPPFLLLAIRFTIGAAALWLFSVLMNRRGWQGFNRAELTRGAVAGVLLFLSFAAQTVGAGLTSPGKCGLLTGVYVVCVPIMASAMKKRVYGKALALSVVCFVGIGIVSEVSIARMQMNLGDALSILCGVLFAAHMIALERFTADGAANLTRLTVAQLAAVAVLSAAASPILDAGQFAAIAWRETLPWFLFTGLASSAAAYLIQTVVQSKLPAHTVAVVSCMEVVFAVVFSLLLGYDAASPRLLAGGLVIVGTMVYTSMTSETGQ